MKFNILTWCLCFFLGFNPFTLNGAKKSPTVSDALHVYTSKAGRLIGKKYALHYCGVGGSVVKNKISEISYTYQRFGSPLNEEEARKLIINCLNGILDEINRENAARPFLVDYPLTPKNINIDIYVFKPDRWDYSHPNISVVSARNGIISFFTHEEKNRYKYKSEKYETFDEAVAILQNQSGKTPTNITESDRGNFSLEAPRS